MHVHLNNTVHLAVDARYTVVGGEAKSLYRVPELFMNGKLYYEGEWFNNFIRELIQRHSIHPELQPHQHQCYSISYV